MIISHICVDQTDSNLPMCIIQTDKSHNKGVAELASSFASGFGFAQWGYVMGLLHDKGKEQEGFQKYIQGITGYKLEWLNSPRVSHAYVGALIVRKLYPQYDPAMSYPILGHHAGLSDYDDFEEAMKKQVPDDVKIEELGVKLGIPSSFEPSKKDFHHWIRMLYSCLVDADYLDTESFMNHGNSMVRSNKNSLSKLLPKLDSYLLRLKSNTMDSPVNKIRAEIQQCCREYATGRPGFYSLTVPTGGGKTLSSLVWAMSHAVKYEKKRIIIAIPYTSIIVQTAQVLRNIFGDENVLEHHSNFDADAIGDKTLSLKMKLATENWDYPIIVTTNVQLFESMFSNKPSSCRKLHNICNSVLILDEVQTLPLEYLQPIIDSLISYQTLFGVSVLFTTASLPAFEGKICNSGNTKLNGIPGIKEIIPANLKLFDRLTRVKLHFDDNLSSYDEISKRILKYKRVLCIVNTRKDAHEIYSRLPQEGITLHLSRMMCPLHVSRVISKMKEALEDKTQTVIRVVSTQLIEAGVDIDFPVVFRQESGLDSVLQAAGRCNREGRFFRGDTYVFSLNKPLPSGYISNANNARKNLKEVSDWYSPQTMHDYFIQLYSRTDCFDKAGIAAYLYKPKELCFATAAKRFKLIKDEGVNVIVNYGNSLEWIEVLKREGPNYKVMKQLGQYTVSLYKRDFDKLRDAGMIEEIITGVFLLVDRTQYDNNVGLMVENHWMEEILIK